MFQGDRLKLLREEMNISQEELGIMLGVSDPTINRYEKGQRQPNTTMLCKIADYFCVSVDYLLGRKEDRLDE